MLQLYLYHVSWCIQVFYNYLILSANSLWLSSNSIDDVNTRTNYMQPCWTLLKIKLYPVVNLQPPTNAWDTNFLIVYLPTFNFQLISLQLVTTSATSLHVVVIIVGSPFNTHTRTHKRMHTHTHNTQWQHTCTHMHTHDTLCALSWLSVCMPPCNCCVV